MGRHPARRQAGSHHLAFERGPRASKGIDTRVEHDNGPIGAGPMELTLRQPGVEPLTAAEDAVLTGHLPHQGADNRRVGSKPERITHRYGT